MMREITEQERRLGASHLLQALAVCKYIDGRLAEKPHCSHPIPEPPDLADPEEKAMDRVSDALKRVDDAAYVIHLLVVLLHS